MKKSLLVVYLCLFTTTIITAQKQNISSQKRLTMANQTEKLNLVLQDYLDGMVNKDTSLISKIFTPTAQMFLMKEGQLTQIPIFPGLIQYIQQTPRDNEANTKIISADITGNAASGKVEVISKGLIYTDYFNLLLTNDSWKIVNKTFSVTPVK